MTTLPSKTCFTTKPELFRGDKDRRRETSPPGRRLWPRRTGVSHRRRGRASWGLGLGRGSHAQLRAGSLRSRRRRRLGGPGRPSLDLSPVAAPRSAPPPRPLGSTSAPQPPTQAPASPPPVGPSLTPAPLGFLFRNPRPPGGLATTPGTCSLYATSGLGAGRASPSHKLQLPAASARARPRQVNSGRRISRGHGRHGLPSIPRAPGGFGVARRPRSPASEGQQVAASVKPRSGPLADGGGGEGVRAEGVGRPADGRRGASALLRGEGVRVARSPRESGVTGYRPTWPSCPLAQAALNEEQAAPEATAFTGCGFGWVRPPAVAEAPQRRGCSWGFPAKVRAGVAALGAGQDRSVRNAFWDATEEQTD